MAYDKENEKKIAFERIGQSIENMWDIITRCNHTLNSIGFNDAKIPNIIVSYGDKYLEIAEKFEKANIDFYAQNCESRYIIENKLQAKILKGEDYLSKFEVYLNVSKQIIEQEISRNKRLRIEENKNQAKPLKEDIRTIPQIITAKKYLEDLIEVDKYIRKFDIQEEMIGAILYYRTLALTNGVLDFDDRIEKIDEELIKLGYTGVKQIYYGELEKQSTGIRTIETIQSKTLDKAILLEDSER